VTRSRACAEWDGGGALESRRAEQADRLIAGREPQGSSRSDPDEFACVVDLAEVSINSDIEVVVKGPGPRPASRKIDDVGWRRRERKKRPGRQVAARLLAPHKDVRRRSDVTRSVGSRRRRRALFRRAECLLLDPHVTNRHDDLEDYRIAHATPSLTNTGGKGVTPAASPSIDKRSVNQGRHAQHKPWLCGSLSRFWLPDGGRSSRDRPSA